MRVLVVGAGAVGSFLGWAVAAGGGRTTLVRRSFAGSPGTREPLTVVRPDGTTSRVEVALVADPATTPEPPELILVAVKQYDLPAALEALRAWPAAPLVTAENGVGAEEVAGAARPGTTRLAASVTASVERARDGSIGWLRTGGLGLAPVDGADAAAVAERFAALVEAAGVPVRLLPDAPAMKWSKLVANLVGNATSALLDLDPAEVYADADLFAIERDQLREGLAVMDVLGLDPVDLPGASVRSLARATSLPAVVGRQILVRVVGSARGGKEPSLRGAVRAGGRTEIAWLNGAVARTGRERGVAVPVNTALAALVAEAAADPARRDWFRGRPDRLVAELGRG